MTIYIPVFIRHSLTVKWSVIWGESVLLRFFAVLSIYALQLDSNVVYVHGQNQFCFKFFKCLVVFNTIGCNI